MTIDYRINAGLDAATLNRFRVDNWPEVGPVEWDAMRPHSLLWICAYGGAELVGFVNVVGDGGQHAFILDTIVAVTHRRRGIGAALIDIAAEQAHGRGCEWLHVDYDDDAGAFYRSCGFEPCLAGLRPLF